MTEHFKLSIRAMKALRNHDATGIHLELTGCRDCMKQAITLLLVHDPEFRGMINECGRAANEIRFPKNPPIDPQKN